MTVEKKYLLASDIVEVVMALIQIAICRFMVKRPDWWDSISHKRRQLNKNIKKGLYKIIRKPGVFDGKTGSYSLAPSIRYFDDEFLNLVFKESRRSREKKRLQSVARSFL